MKKILKCLKSNKKIILSCMFIVVLLFAFIICNNTIYGASNPGINGGTDKSLIEDFIQYLLGKVMEGAVGVLGMPFAAIINVVNVILLTLIYSICLSGHLTNGLAFPFPDQIIFNGVPMLDPNFINPTNDSYAIVNIMKGMVQKTYYSFFALAGTVFVLAAVVIGIKLAFSSLASEKAMYKEAIKHWLTGIAALFLMHFALAGMFAINEQVCIASSKFCDNVEIEIGNIFEDLPGVGTVGSMIKDLVKGVAGLISEDLAHSVEDFGSIKMKGYGGVIVRFIFQGCLMQDVVYAIGLSILLGQTFSLMLMYLKRVFYCIILGMIAPLVIAMDTVQKVVTGKDSGVLKNWFQNMIAIIFNQSFQAIFLCVSTLIIGQISNADHSSDLINGLICIISLNAIMKFDKLFKELLGIKDSKIMGGFNENAMRSFAAIKSGMALANRSTEPFKKRTEAQHRINAARKKRDKIASSIASLNGGSGGSGGNTNINGSTTINGATVTGGNTGGLGGAANDSQVVAAMTKLTQALDNNTSSKDKEKREKLYDDLAGAEAELERAKADKRAESMRAFTRFGTTLGAVGFGIGATDNIGDAISVGNIVDLPMDAMSDRAVNRGVYGHAGSKIDSRRDDLVKKYMSSGRMSSEAAEKAADAAISSMHAQLDKAIPEAVSHMIGDVSKDIAKGTADMIDKNGRKYSKKVQKKIYSSGSVDNI